MVSAGGVAQCPACGYAEAATVVPPVVSEVHEVTEVSGARGSAGGWIFFFVMLLSPGVLSLLLIKSKDLWPVVAIGGSAVAGIYCGIWLALRVAREPLWRGILGFVFAGVFFALGLFLAFVGCALGGGANM